MATVMKDIKHESDPDAWEVLSGNASTVALEEASEIGLLEGISSNPIGELQEFCVSRKLPPPEYKDGPRTGPPHLPTFFCDCTLKGLSFSASASSKKLAKKAAAAGILAELKRENQSDDPLGGSSRIVSHEHAELENALNRLAIKTEAAPFDSGSVADVETFLSNLARTLDVDLVSRAESDIEGRSVWICELAGTVITGYGKTPHEARLDAAQAVVHSLRQKLRSH